MFLRTLLTTSAFALFAATGAMAADAVVEDPVPIVVEPSFSWTGGYIGIQGGYAFADGELNDGTDFISDEFGGGLLGAYIGFNWQHGAFVFGAEGDINGVWNEETFFFPAYAVEVGTDYLASLRGRAGYAWDRTLLFATAGVAFTEASAETNIGGFNVSASQSLTGWTIGAGVEHAFTDNWLGRAEYRYYDFGDKDIGVFNDVEVQNQTLTLGIAYKF